MKKLINIALILILTGFSGVAQEQLVGLQGNPQLQKYAATHDLTTKSGVRADTLELPFFDDFARITVYPDQSKWMDYDAYINNQWAINPMSYGVASLDIADSLGVVRGLSSAGEVSDYLTSRPINLNYTAADSVYLSFAWQRAGNCRKPEVQDSLVLEMRSPDTTWISIWRVEGGVADTVFTYELIPISQDYLLKKGFQFRFKNYGSTVANSPEPSYNSNNDVWHLDYIWLDTARTAADTLIEDVAFTENFTSLVKGYESVPWKHFLNQAESLTRDSVTFMYRNNGLTDVQVDRQLLITDMWGNGDYYTIFNDNENIFGLESISYTRPIADYTFESDLEDSARFRVRGVLKTDTVSDRKKFRWNDTVYFYQQFENLYAYDDGTPEVGYGIGGVGTSSAAVACRFEPLVPDSLRGVYIYFNKVLNDENVQYFYLTVWEDNEGVPGDTLLKKIGVKPLHQDSLYEYRYYSLDTSIYVEDAFHIGWIKTTDDMLNVGFDVNRDASENLHYNTFGTWQQTSYEGAAMVRPVLAEHEIVSVPEHPETEKPDVAVYPNPASGEIRFQSQTDFTRCSIYASDGRLIRNELFTRRMDVSALPEGMYILVLQRKNGKPVQTKLIINR